MISKIITDYKDNLDVELMLSNVCNYKCHYCFPGFNEGNLKWPKENYDILVKNLKTLFNFYKTNHGKQKFHVKIMGGEPTVWSELPRFVYDLKQAEQCFIRMSTNASRTMRYWKENSALFDQIIISVHNGFADMDHIINVSNYIYSTGKTNLYVTVLMDPYNWKKSVDNFEYLYYNSTNWHLAVAPVNFEGLTQYSKEQLDYMNNAPKRTATQPIDLYKGLTPTVFLDEHGNKVETDQHSIIANRQNQFKGFKCNIGIDKIFLYGDGEIKGACGQKFFNNVNIYNDSFAEQLGTTPLNASTCTQNACSCSSEVIIAKSSQ